MSTLILMVTLCGVGDCISIMLSYTNGRARQGLSSSMENQEKPNAHPVILVSLYKMHHIAIGFD